MKGYNAFEALLCSVKKVTREETEKHIQKLWFHEVTYPAYVKNMNMLQWENHQGKNDAKKRTHILSLSLIEHNLCRATSSTKAPIVAKARYNTEDSGSE